MVDPKDHFEVFSNDIFGFSIILRNFEETVIDKVKVKVWFWAFFDGFTDTLESGNKPCILFRSGLTLKISVLKNLPIIDGKEWLPLVKNE